MVKAVTPPLLTHAPNELQLIPLAWVLPSEDNCRLYIEREKLDRLRVLYWAWAHGEEVILPDAPVLRYRGMRGKTPILEIMAGERRVTAAQLEKVTHLLCRVVTMEDSEAYRFILAHNDVENLTTVELAFRAAEMDRLGFDHEEISKALGGVSLHRYLEVGQSINPDWFTDDAKLCDPSIVEWFEAAQFGPKHFERCFKHWNLGLWDEKRCTKEFRRRGKALPLDNAERGLRVTFDQRRAVFRGQVDLDMHEPKVAMAMLNNLRIYVEEAIQQIEENGDNADFGPREVFKINPETV